MRDGSSDTADRPRTGSESTQRPRPEGGKRRFSLLWGDRQGGRGAGGREGAGGGRHSRREGKGAGGADRPAQCVGPAGPSGNTRVSAEAASSREGGTGGRAGETVEETGGNRAQEQGARGEAKGGGGNRNFPAKWGTFMCVRAFMHAREFPREIEGEKEVRWERSGDG